MQISRDIHVDRGRAGASTALAVREGGESSKRSLSESTARRNAGRSVPNFPDPAIGGGRSDLANVEYMGGTCRLLDVTPCGDDRR